ncbi:MAG: mannitol dehydrogenase family protein [Proteobacteria bacterium]|nr:mannitol dehydrogenase family protein [Pseudomonadota bacterium]
MRLSPACLGGLPTGITRPGYDRAAQAVGIVHFGIGAFHRAHMAWYTDRAMAAGDRDWMITGVSLRSAGVAEQLNPQGGLYTLAERSARGTALAVIGAVREVLVASREGAAVVAALAVPATRIASFTITEKGYCRRADGSLDLALADQGFYPLLAEGLARRQAAGLGGLTLLSCDNLADNGQQLERLMGAYLAARMPALAPWFAGNCTCPATMIDRIVPATTPADLAEVAGALGLSDAAAVVTEPFSQWVIEDRFAGPRPRWEAVGAELVAQVAPYESAKLRMLNGAHSALAYLGLRHGHTFVHQAVADPAIRPLIERLMRVEAAPTVAAAPGHDLAAYADALLARFANPALNHRLIQIAMDGSQKVPQRWLETLAEQQRRGQDCPAILAALAGWLRHLRGDNAEPWGPVDDPLAQPLADAWRHHGAGGIVAALFGPAGLVSATWTPTAADHATLAQLLEAA